MICISFPSRFTRRRISPAPAFSRASAAWLTSTTFSPLMASRVSPTRIPASRAGGAVSSLDVEVVVAHYSDTPGMNFNPDGVTSGNQVDLGEDIYGDLAQRDNAQQGEFQLNFPQTPGFQVKGGGYAPGCQGQIVPVQL